MSLAKTLRQWLRKKGFFPRRVKLGSLRLFVEELERRETPSTMDLALSGTAYRWYGLGSATANSNRALAAGLNDNNLSADVTLTGAGGDATNAYEAGGII